MARIFEMILFFRHLDDRGKRLTEQLFKPATIQVEMGLLNKWIFFYAYIVLLLSAKSLGHRQTQSNWVEEHAKHVLLTGTGHNK